MTNENSPQPEPHVVDSVINEKKDHITEVAQPSIEKLTARQEAYQRIVDVTKQGMEEYYRRWPERAVDERSQDAENASLGGLRQIFAILNEYIISFRMERNSNEQHTAEPADTAAPATEPSGGNSLPDSSLH